jgi:hypothetical protein
MDPASEAYLLSTALKNTVDSVDTVIGWFKDDPAASTVNDPRIDQILGELSQISSAIEGIHAKLDALNYKIAVLQHQVSELEKSQKKQHLENVLSWSTTAKDALDDWDYNGRNDAAMLQEAWVNSEWAVNAFENGVQTDAFWYTNVAGGGVRTFDFRLALPVYIHALAVRIAVATARYGSATQMPPYLQTNLREYATHLDDIFALAAEQERCEVTSLTNSGRTKFTIVSFCKSNFWMERIDSLPKSCMYERRAYYNAQGNVVEEPGKTLCWLHEPNAVSTWYAYQSESHMNAAKNAITPLAMTMFRMNSGSIWAQEMAKKLRSLADFRRARTIHRL